MPDNLGLVKHLRPTQPEKPRSSELPLDTEQFGNWCDDDESSMRIVGYAALAVTFVVFVVLLWPWLVA